MDQYFVLQVSGVKSGAEEWLSQTAFDYGALGVSEVLPFEQPEGEEDVFTRIPDRRDLSIYFSAAPASSFLETIHAHLPQVRLNVQSETNKDWLAEWKKGFAPFALTGSHWVVPSWCEPPANAQHKIWIDPGMAFGTGTHETTQLVASFLSELAAATPLGHVLDVGTGTGILAILAKQLGATRVHATEIEADSRRVAHENFARNGAEDIRLDERQVEDLLERYDLVVANIIDGVLVRIQEELKARVKPGGWLVLSGIISEREQDFLNGFRLPAGKKWDRRVQQGDWLLYAVKL